MTPPRLACLVALACAIVASDARAAQTKVAVAANFTAAANEIAAAFKAETGHEALLSFGSTGKFYAQIVNGAPFAVFLSADAETPAKAEAEGFAVPGSAFTYAVGRLALVSADPALVDDAGKVLASGAFAKLAIANPKTAPYGAAAMQALEKLGVLDATKDKIVMGDNIAQTFQFVTTGNAQLGFVALSQVIGSPDGSRWVVPQDLHDPLTQDAVLLKPGADDAAAKAFLAFLKGGTARAIIEKYGYGLEE